MDDESDKGDKKPTKPRAPKKKPVGRPRKPPAPAPVKAKIVTDKPLVKGKIVGRPKQPPKQAGRAKTKSLKDEIELAVGDVQSKLYVRFDSDIFIDILTKLATYDVEKMRYPTLTEVLSEDGMPTSVSFYRWLNADDTGELLKAYEFVRKSCSNAMVDEMIKIAFDSQIDVQFKDNGEVDFHKLSVQRSKLIIETIQWRAARISPDEWSGKTTVDVNGSVDADTLEKLAAIGVENRALAAEKARLHAESMRDFGIGDD